MAMHSSVNRIEAAGLVELLGASRGVERFESYQALVAMGTHALPALRHGLRHTEWQVRRWCAICLDQVADEEALADLLPLMHDPHPKVRLWAVHSVACDHCKDGVACPVDVVPHLIERIRQDSNLRVRRMAVIMLGSEFSDPRAIDVLTDVVSQETDTRLVLHAKRALDRLRSRGVTAQEPAL